MEKGNGCNMIVFKPILPWTIIIVLLSGICILLVFLRGYFDQWRIFGYHRITRVLSVTFSTFAAIFFILASLNPYRINSPDGHHYHVVVAMDVSASVLGENQWKKTLSRVAEHINDVVRSISKDIRSKAYASIVSFGNGVAVVHKKIKLEKLSASVLTTSKKDLAPGDETDIAEGIKRAGQLIDECGGLGMIVLMSDGNQTKGNALLEANRLARNGIPIHVFPLQCINSGIKITSANLPPYVKTDGKTFLRGNIQNGQSQHVKAHLSIDVNPGVDTSSGKFTQHLTTKYNLDLSANDWGNFRVPIQFDGYGLQFVDINLVTNEQRSHLRRLYTHVKSIPKVLAIGGDNRWVTAFSKDVAEIFQVQPDQIPDVKSLSKFDAIVISEVAAHYFSSQSLKNIRNVVKNNGTGLMLINGQYYSSDNNYESPTMIMTYEKSEIAKLLPVSSKPRAFKKQNPPRYVIFMIDASGSMGGWQLEKSKEIATYIVEHTLKEEDFLDVLVFTTGIDHKVNQLKMNAGGKKIAIERINSISAGGGTDPTLALKLIADRKMNNCGLVFISDGEFNTVAFRPECRATVFAVGHETIPSNSPLKELADPFAVNRSFSPYNIKIPYFNPEPRKRFFEPGMFTPLRLGRLSKRFSFLKVPPKKLNGAAVTYIKANSQLVAVRPKYTDPVLAYKEFGQGYVGVFTSKLTNEWFNDHKGQKAIKSWISHTISYMARDRYDFRLIDNGDSIHLKISIISKDNNPPDVNRMSASLMLENHQKITVPLISDPDIFNTFEGYIRIERKQAPQKTTLILKEFGNNIVSRPQQIPLLIPSIGQVEKSLTNEYNSYDMNKALLKAISKCTGGVYQPGYNKVIFQQNQFQSKGKALWPWLIVFGAIFYLASITSTRIDP